MILQKLKKLLKSFEIRNIKNMELEHSKGKPLQIRAIFTIFQNRSGFRNGFRRDLVSDFVPDFMKNWIVWNLMHFCNFYSTKLNFLTHQSLSEYHKHYCGMLRGVLAHWSVQKMKQDLQSVYKLLQFPLNSKIRIFCKFSLKSLKNIV